MVFCTTQLAGAQTWHNYQGDRGHSGFAAVQVDQLSLGELWRWQVGLAAPLTQAVAENGQLFFTDSRFGYNTRLHVFAMDGSLGIVNWQIDYAGYSDITGLGMQSGELFYSTIDSNAMGSFNGVTTAGTTLFNNHIWTQWFNFFAPTVDAGSAYTLGNSYCGLYSFSTATGAANWFNGTFQLYDAWAPALDDTYAYAYAPLYSPFTAGVNIVSRSTGQLAGTIPDPGWGNVAYDINQTLAIQNGMGFATNNNRLVAFDLVNQKLAWQQSRACSGQATVAGGVVYAVDAGALSAFDTATGAFLWAWAPPAGNLAANIIATNNIVFTTDKFNTYAIDPVSHKMVWSVNNGGQLSVADGRLYIAGETGAASAVNLGSLQVTQPSSLRLVRGTPLAGGLPAIQFADGNSLAVRPGFTLSPGEAPVQLIVTATAAVTSPTQLTMHVRSATSERGIQQTAELWNYATQRWVTAGTTMENTSQTDFDATVANPTQYVDPASGQVQARLSFKIAMPVLSAAWTVSIDQAAWLER